MKAHIVAAGCAMFCLMAAQSVMALSIDYSYSAYTNIGSWGTMDINVVDTSTLSVLYTAAGNVPTNAQATGFAFSFAGISSSPTISNPDVDGNDDSLTWLLANKAGTLPSIANWNDFSPAISNTYAFEMAATEGKANNYNVPGIRAGNKDVFHLNFATDIFSAASAIDLADFVKLTAVRLQGFDDGFNKGTVEGSLFLAGKERDPGNPVPEPGTMMLLGAGFLGIAIYGKRRKNA